MASDFISEPVPEYGNNECVILVTLVESDKDEFNLTDVVQMTASPYIGGSNDLEISGRKNKFVYKGGLAAAWLGTKDKENRAENTYVEKPDKSGIWLDERRILDFKDINKSLSFDANATFGWIITPEHHIDIRYEYDYLKSNGEDGDRNDCIYKRKGQTIDLVNPSDEFQAESVSNSQRHRHSLSLSYQGQANDWKITANIDLFAGKKTGTSKDHEYPGGIKKCTADNSSRYEVGEGYSRFNASHPLWKGEILFGVSLDNYLQSTWSDDYMDKSKFIHNDLYNIIPGAYVSLKQDFGFLNVDFGVHYQQYFGKYKPCEDDMTRDRIIELIGKPYISFSDWLIHPHLTLSTSIGEVKLAAGGLSTTEFPQFSSLKIRINDLKKSDASEAFAFPGRKDEIFLKGEWNWIQLKGWSTNYYKPIFLNIDSGGDFSGPDYWAMDWKLALSPSVGIWSSDFTLTFHKQWLQMDVVDPADNLQSPFFTANWINTFSLPWGMRVDLATFLHTKGADKNIYYYRNFFCKASLSIQQSFLKNHLTVSLEMKNLLRSNEVAACYTRMSEKEFDFNDRIEHRMFALTVKFKL